MVPKPLVLKRTRLEEFPEYPELKKNELGEEVIEAETIDLPRWSKCPYDYSNLSEKYIVDFPDKIRFAQNQYNQVYQTRYLQLENVIKSKGLATDKHKSHPFKFLSQIQDGETAFVIGIIFRKSAKRPSVLVNFDDNEEEDGEVQLTVDENPDEIVTDADWLELEDAQTQSIRLSNIQLGDFATGMVVGLFGTKVNSNDFKVSDVIFPGPPIDRSLPPVLDDDSYVVFLSGLSANRENSFDWTLRFRSLRVALSRPPFNGKLDRLIICGNLSVDFCDCSKCASISMDDVKHLGATKDPAKNQAYITMLDKLSRYFRTTQFDLMPGDEDPTSAMWPQDPINDALIKDFVFGEENEAYMLESQYEPSESDDEELYATIGGPVPLRVKAKVNSVPNPYEFETQGFRFLGSCGENVHNLRRMSDPKAHNELIMEKLLDLCHICPTAPQAPDCYPFDDKKVDPFIIEQLPHVFFVGNQDGAFSYTRQYPGNEKTDGKPVKVQFVGIPRSKHTMCAYALNLRTMRLDAINMKHFNVMQKKKLKPKKKVIA